MYAAMPSSFEDGLDCGYFHTSQTVFVDATSGSIFADSLGASIMKPSPVHNLAVE